jgi:ketosteroid isomerase-like protein
MKLLPALPFLLLVAGCASVPPAGERAAGASAVAAVLDGFHEAASRADGDAYFAALAPDAVFIGTDASERWSVAEFRAFADPYFSAGRGWTYVPRDRHIHVGPGGDIAWFDEMLDNASYGVCRGTGVLVRAADGWKIAQYHLTIPIPNDLAKEIVGIIRR